MGTKLRIHTEIIKKLKFHGPLLGCLEVLKRLYGFWCVWAETNNVTEVMLG